MNRFGTKMWRKVGGLASLLLLSVLGVLLSSGSVSALNFSLDVEPTGLIVTGSSVRATCGWQGAPASDDNGAVAIQCTPPSSSRVLQTVEQKTNTHVVDGYFYEAEIQLRTTSATSADRPIIWSPASNDNFDIIGYEEVLVEKESSSTYLYQYNLYLRSKVTGDVPLKLGNSGSNFITWASSTNGFSFLWRKTTEYKPKTVTYNGATSQDIQQQTTDINNQIDSSAQDVIDNENNNRSSDQQSLNSGISSAQSTLNQQSSVINTAAGGLLSALSSMFSLFTAWLTPDSSVGCDFDIPFLSTIHVDLCDATAFPSAILELSRTLSYAFALFYIFGFFRSTWDDLMDWLAMCANNNIPGRGERV